MNVERFGSVLSQFGIDSRLAEDGFRAAHPFPVAVRLAIMGFRCLPTRVSTKIPNVSGWTEKATTDPKKLGRWQRQFNPNWSVLTGRDNNLIVLDSDGERGRQDLFELEAKLEPLPKTVICNSGRIGGGFHVWLRPPAGVDDIRNQQPLPGTKVDVRGWHGHVVIAGSHHKSGNRYAWAPGCAPDEIDVAECPALWWEWLPKKDFGSGCGGIASKTGNRPRPVKRSHSDGSLLIGDGMGFGGFQNPIYKNAIQYFSQAGAEASAEAIIALLREIIADAPKDQGRDVSRYMDGPDLPRMVDRARAYVEFKKDAQNE